MQKPSCSLAVTTASAERNIAARSGSSTAPTTCTPGEIELLDLLADRAGVALEPLVADEHAGSRASRGTSRRRASSARGSRAACAASADRPTTGSAPSNVGEVVHRRLRAASTVERRRRFDDGRDDAHVAVAHRLELARVVVRVGDRAHDPRAQALDLAPPEREQIGEHRVVRFEVLARRDVVVHEHERFGARRQELVHLGLTDRRVEDQEVARVARAVARRAAARRRAARARCGGRRSPTARPGAAAGACRARGS